MLQALDKFGSNLYERQETILDVQGKKVALPDNFGKLYYAVRCEGGGFDIPEEARDFVLSSSTWVERVERNKNWNSCDVCCVDESIKLVSEKVVIKDFSIDLQYINPKPLQLAKSMKKSEVCHAKCRNTQIQSPHEIMINRKTLYTNFDDGFIYMQYDGLPVDEDDIVMIPEIGKNILLEYIMAYVSSKYYLYLLESGKKMDVGNLLSLWMGEERRLLGEALTDVKFANASPKSFMKFADKNREDFKRFEFTERY